MSAPPVPREARLRRQQALMIAHASLVLLVALVAGFGLTFELLGKIALWPIPVSIDLDVPGSVRGWRAAHTGGLLNGVMILGFALALPLLPLREGGRKWVVWGLIYTGWANTAFYWFGNVAPNRGLSGGATPFGEGTLAGLLAYLPAATATGVTMVAVGLAAAAALRSARGEHTPPGA